MQGVVFDFDGVIADSMPQHAEAYRRTLARHDVPVEDAVIFNHEGARSETILRDLLQQHGHDDIDDRTVRDLADEKQRVFKELGTPSLYAGAPEMVAAIQTVTRKTGLVTGTRRENLERMIPDLLPRFGAVLSQSDYTHDKPHPEPYAKAAQALALDPDRCIAVENAVRGVQSARNAGYGTVLAIATTMPAKDLEAAGADHVAEDHAGLQQRILAVLADTPATGS